MAKCVYCGGELTVAEAINGYHLGCHSINQQSEKDENESDIKISNTESSFSINKAVADMFIFLSTVLFGLGIISVFVIGASLPRDGFIFIFIGMLVLLVSWGAFAVVAEIYRNLKEINAKIKSPDKD